MNNMNTNEPNIEENNMNNNELNAEENINVDPDTKDFNKKVIKYLFTLSLLTLGLELVKLHIPYNEVSCKSLELNYIRKIEHDKESYNLNFGLESNLTITNNYEFTCFVKNIYDRKNCKDYINTYSNNNIFDCYLYYNNVYVYSPIHRYIEMTQALFTLCLIVSAILFVLFGLRFHSCH